jgi:hypothetical protein
LDSRWSASRPSISREPTGYVARADRHGEDKDWPVIETCRSLDGAQKAAQGVFRLGLLPAQSLLLTGHDLMPKYAMVRFRGKEMRVAYQPSFSALASGSNAELDWWFADLTTQERDQLYVTLREGIDPKANPRRMQEISDYGRCINKVVKCLLIVREIANSNQPRCRLEQSTQLLKALRPICGDLPGVQRHQPITQCP